MSIEKFEALKKKLAAAQSVYDREKGKQEAALAQLREMGYETEEDAEAALAGMETRYAELEQEGEALIAEYETKFGIKDEGISG